MPRPKAFTEEEVLKKAADLFWKQGFHATSMDNLVKELGINRASIYNTFGGKKALFEKALSSYQNENKTRIDNFLTKQSSIKEGIKKLFLLEINDVFNDCDRKGCMVVNCTTELLPTDKDFLKIAMENRENFTAFFKDYLHKGVDNGEIAADKNLDAIAGLLFTLYNGLKVVAKTNISKEELTNSILVGLSVLD